MQVPSILDPAKSKLKGYSLQSLHVPAVGLWRGEPAKHLIKEHVALDCD